MKLGIALSGGGIRGIAHAGVLKALEDNNIKPDIIGGTSAGSMIASLYAIGYSPYYIYILFKRYAAELAYVSGSPIISGIGNFMMNRKSILQGLKDGKSLETIYNKIAYKKGIRKINQIKMPLVISSVDITNSKEYISKTKTDFNEKMNLLINMTSEEKMMQEIENKNLDSNFVELYRELMLGDKMEEDLKQMVKSLEEASTTINNILDTQEKVIDLLINNKGKWEVQGKQIQFSTQKLVNEYNDLIRDL